MTCETCGGVIAGSWGHGDVCTCERRLQRDYIQPAVDQLFADPLVTNSLGEADENDATPTVEWALTTNDRRFLRSLRIGVE